ARLNAVEGRLENMPGSLARFGERQHGVTAQRDAPLARRRAADTHHDHPTFGALLRDAQPKARQHAVPDFDAAGGRPLQSGDGKIGQLHPRPEQYPRLSLGTAWESWTLDTGRFRVLRHDS